MKSSKYHKDFSLNGIQFDSSLELINYAKKFAEPVYSFLNSWFDDNAFVLVKTSGSTGKPKEIKLAKEHMINSAITTGKYFNLPEKTKALLCLPVNFIAGKMMLVRALTLGWHLDVVEPKSAPLKGNVKHYDFAAMVPLQVYHSLAKLSQIKKLIIGGGVVSKDLEEKLQEASTQCYATYGMTETITHIAVKKLNHFSLREGTTKQSVEKNNQITSLLMAGHNDVYSILPNISISKDSRGCLVIEAPKVSNGQVVTNDLVEIISETAFKWLGRYDNIINSGGVKLIPEQIELKLSEIIDQRFFVIGVPDNQLGEKLILVIESENKDDTIFEQIENLKLLSKFEMPKGVYFIEKFLETETKKIQRQQTLDLLFS